MIGSCQTYTITDPRKHYFFALFRSGKLGFYLRPLNLAHRNSWVIEFQAIFHLHLKKHLSSENQIILSGLSSAPLGDYAKIPSETVLCENETLVCP